MLIRNATLADTQSLLAIYQPYVETTAISFETVAPTSKEFAQRVTKALADWAWLVAEINGQAIGYAYATAHRPRQAYRWSVETSAYVHADHHRQGVAQALYAELLEQLAAKGFCNAYAGVALPNDASVALHQRVGFEPIGVFPAVGRKFGCWYDVAWFHCRLRSAPPEE